MKIKNLKEYYMNFFNYNYCRDLRVIYPPILFSKSNEVKNPNPKVLHANKYPKTVTDLTMSDWFYKFLMNPKYRKGIGNFYYEVSHYGSLARYRNKDSNQPYTDRLFFDFDLEDNPLVNEVKAELKTARTTLTGKSKVKAEKVAQRKFRDILFNTDVLKTPFEEANRLYCYFNNFGCESYLLFSGSKGLALNIFGFKSLPLNYISNISYGLATSLKDGLKLSTLDLSVNKDSKKRVQRIPYTKNTNTLLMNQPVEPGISFNEFLDIISNKKVRVADLDISNYSDTKFITKYLLDSEKACAKAAKAKEEALAKLEQVRRNKPAYNVNFNGGRDEIFKDCRILAKILLGPPEKEYAEYNTYLCPFHDDNVASARVYESNFFCAGCGVYYRYFDFIRAVKELETGKPLTNEDVKEEMRIIKSSVKSS